MHKHPQGGRKWETGSLSACVLDHWALMVPGGLECPHWAWKQSPGHGDPRWFTKHVSPSLAPVNGISAVPRKVTGHGSSGLEQTTTPCLMAAQRSEPAGASQASVPQEAVMRGWDTRSE